MPVPGSRSFYKVTFHYGQQAIHSSPYHIEGRQFNQGNPHTDKKSILGRGLNGCFSYPCPE